VSQATAPRTRAEWLGRDVTDDPNYVNRTLAESGWPNRAATPRTRPARSSSVAEAERFDEALEHLVLAFERRAVIGESDGWRSLAG
jgi:hypothetical protein